jgi:prophage antirepressor-like protein
MTYKRRITRKAGSRMNGLKVFESSEFGKVRSVMLDGVPWFVGKDAAEALGYTNASKAIKDHVDDEDKLNNESLSSIGQRGGWLINESGLYSLIFGSQLDSSKRFKRWITSEVLPSLREAGSYSIAKRQDSYMIDDPVERAKRWIEEQEQLKTLESKITELAPKAKLCDDLLDAKLLVNFRDAAKEIGISQTQFTGWLMDNGYVYTTPSGELRPMELYMESGLFQLKPYQNPYNGYKGSRTYITGRGLAAFKTLIDREGHSRHTMKKHGGKKSR